MTDNSTVRTDANFGLYGKPFQEKVMQALLTDRQWAEQMTEVFDVSYFDLRYLQFLGERYFAHSKKYKVFPSFQLLVTIIRDDLKSGSDVLLRDQIIEYLQRMRANPDSGDLQYIKEKSLDFCRKQALKQELLVAAEKMHDGKYEEIVEGIKKAVCVGTTPSLGHEFFMDYESRFTRLQRNCVPTGLEELDRKEVLNGGLGAGELGVVIAPTGVGKSHFLVALGSQALREGRNVLHYTLELSEAAVGLRYDSNLCDIDSNIVIENKDKIIETYKGMQLGRLMIKEFPANTATIYTVRAHIERLDLRGFRPDLLIIDYADIMRSSRQYDSLRHELKLIYEELRSFLQEKHIPGWTASQSNREGSNQEVVDLNNMSEAYGKAFVADAVLSLSRRTHEKATGEGRLCVAKNRFGRDGLVYPLLIDTARSKFAVAGNVMSFQKATEDDEKASKRQILAKLEEMKREQLNPGPKPAGDDAPAPAAE